MKRLNKLGLPQALCWHVSRGLDMDTNWSLGFTQKDNNDAAKKNGQLRLTVFQKMVSRIVSRSSYVDKIILSGCSRSTHSQHTETTKEPIRYEHVQN